MPRPSTFPPPIRLHKRGYSYCRVWSGNRPRDVVLGPPGSDKARARYAALLAELTAGNEVPPPRNEAPPGRHQAATVAQVVARWDEHAEATYGAGSGSLKNYRAACRVLVRLCGALPAAGLTPGALEDVMAGMASGSWRTDAERAALPAGRAAGWCRNVVNRQAVRLRTVWRWAERRGLVPPGSWAALRTVPGLARSSRAVRHTPPRRPCTGAELDAVCARAAPAVAAMLRVQWWSGCRPGEARTMRADLIDRSGDVWLYRPEGGGKSAWRDGAAPRVVPLGPECQRVLAPFLAAAGPGEYLFRPDPRRTARGHYTLRGYGRAVAAACRRAGVKLVAYQTRHACRLRVTRAASLDAARALLGHAGVATTLNYAAGVDEQTAVEAARKLA